MRASGVALLVVALAAALSCPVARAAFPGRDGKIVFTRGGNSNAAVGLFVVNPDGTGLEKLATPRGAIASFEDAHWSRDGGSIAFAASMGPTQANLYVVRADGTGKRLVVQGGFAGDPSWSPDGTRIVYDTLWGSSGYQMYAFRLSARKESPIGKDHHNSDAIEDTSPVWSPDGRWICFTRSVGRSQPHLYLEHPDGSDLRRLSGTSANRPDWSPHGDRIAFDNGKDLFLINPDGSGLRRIARDATYAAWSPDGRFIAFQRGDSSRTFAALWVMQANGTRQMALVRNAYFPDWQAKP